MLDLRPAEVDWEPALEWTRFAAQRRALQPVGDPGRAMTIEPLPHPTTGSPYCAGFRVTAEMESGPAVSCEFPLAYFREAAREGARALVAAGKLKAGDFFFYQVACYPTAPAERPNPVLFRAEEIQESLPVIPGRLADLTSRATFVGEPSAEDAPVILTQQVVEEACALAEQAGACETGGILIGHLQKDIETGEIGVLVGAQMPASQTEADLAQLIFTPNTWAAARAALALRHQNEVMLGWWHSHPAKYFCMAECTPEKRRACPLTQNFFSGEDRQLHHTMFPKAYTVALVITLTDDGLKQAVFGWRTGMIRQRGFHILNHASRPIQLVEAIQPPETKPHEKICPQR